MKYLILIFYLLLLANVFSQDEPVKSIYDFNNSIIGHSMIEFDDDKFDKKIKEFEEKIKKGDAKAMNNLANYYTRNNQTEQAKYYYKMAIQNGSEKAKKNLEILDKFLQTINIIDDGWAWDFPNKDSDNQIRKIITGYKVNSKELSIVEAKKMPEVIKEIWNKIFESADLEIVGYTDSEENEKLGLERAEEFAKLFRESGLKDEIKIIKVLGKGAENPVDTNKTLIGRYNNRRVEIIVKNGVETKTNDWRDQLEDE